jgi:predicted O-methyltransferase YrrM
MLRLWKKDVVFLAIAATAIIAVGSLALRVLGEAAWILIVGIAAAVIGLVLLEIYRRLQIQLKAAAGEQMLALRQSYEQIAAFVSVVNTIRPTFPLPASNTWAVSPDLLNQLCRLVLSRQPDHIFEVGSGMSTLTLAYCLRRMGRGRISSLESDARFAAATRQMLAEHNLSDLATVVDAPLTEVQIGTQQWVWYDTDRIPAMPPIDLLFVDGPHGLIQPLARYPALPILSPRLGPNALIVLDDGARPDEKTIAERWNREFGLTSEYLDLEKGAFTFSKRG